MLRSAALAANGVKASSLVRHVHAVRCIMTEISRLACIEFSAAIYCFDTLLLLHVRVLVGLKYGVGNPMWPSSKCHCLFPLLMLRSAVFTANDGKVSSLV